jgi:hypothetical protein
LSVEIELTNTVNLLKKNGELVESREQRERERQMGLSFGKKNFP